MREYHPAAEEVERMLRLSPLRTKPRRSSDIFPRISFFPARRFSGPRPIQEPIQEKEAEHRETALRW